MELLNFATQKIVPWSLGFLILLAAIVCWKTKSWHPVNLRLLRLFISREDIKDEDVANSLHDESAVVGFRMAHGISVHTVEDAKHVARFAKAKNVPLYLIGRSGIGFDVDKLELKRAHDRHWGWYVLSWLAAIAFATASLFCLYTATSKQLTGSLKETKTWVWFDATDATLRQGFFFGHSVAFRQSSCDGAVPSGRPVDDGYDADRRIMCGIWASKDLQVELADSLSGQRSGFSIAAGVALGYALMFVALLREWFAQTRLRELLKRPNPRRNLTP